MNLTINPIKYNNFTNKPKTKNNEASFLHKQINSLPLSTNKYLLNFKGLTRDFKRNVYKNPAEIQLLAEKHSKSNGVVGSLPHEWIKKIPYENREQIIKELYNSFKVTINELRIKNDSEKASNELTTAFQKAGIISESENINLKYINRGAFGDVYKIQGVGKNEYIIKLFREVNNEEKDHGNFFEQNRAAFFQEQAGTNTERVRFYFGDINSGYMVNNYIGENTPIKTKNSNLKIYGLLNTDDSVLSDGHNKIRGYAIDWGGIRIKNPVLAKNKTARKIYEKIYLTPENSRITVFDKLLKTNNTDIITGLAASIDLLNNDRKNYIDKILKTNNAYQVKEAIVYNLNEHLDNVDSYFNKWGGNANDDLKLALLNKFDIFHHINEDHLKYFAESNNNKVKIELIENFYSMPESLIPTMYEKIYPKANDTIKELLISKLSCLPNKQRVSWFEKFANEPDNKFKSNLIENLLILPNDSIKTWFYKYTKDFNSLTDKMKSDLILNLQYLPVNDRLKWFETFANNASDENKEALIYRLKDLPEKDRIKWFESFASNANETITIKLIFNLDCLPEKDKLKWYETFVKMNNENTNHVLINSICVLPNAEREKWVEHFSKGSNEDIKELIKQLYYIKDINTKISWFKTFAQNPNEDIQQTLKNNLYIFPEKVIYELKTFLKNKAA